MPEYFDSTSPTPKKTKVIKGYGNPHKKEENKKDGKPYIQINTDKR